MWFYILIVFCETPWELWVYKFNKINQYFFFAGSYTCQICCETGLCAWREDYMHAYMPTWSLPLKQQSPAWCLQAHIWSQRLPVTLQCLLPLLKLAWKKHFSVAYRTGCSVFLVVASVWYTYISFSALQTDPWDPCCKTWPQNDTIILWDPYLCKTLLHLETVKEKRSFQHGCERQQFWFF